MSKFTTQAEERRTVALKAAAEVFHGKADRAASTAMGGVLTMALYFETYLDLGQIGLGRSDDDDEDDNADR